MALGQAYAAGCVAPDAHTIVDTGAGGGAACAGPQDCPSPASECEVAACLETGCATEPAAAGAPCTEAEGSVCDGEGLCVACVANEDCMDPALACADNTCVPQSCMDGVVSGDESDVDCGGLCPPCANGDSCLEGDDCESLFCADGGTCSACSADDDCTPYACSGGVCLSTCASDDDCAPEGHCFGDTCIDDKALGESCAGGGECLSDFCSDGVCCDAACSGGCDTCDTSGTCGTSTAGSAGDPSCSPYLCDGVNGSCPASCSNDGDCAVGHHCQGSSCQPDQPNGAACLTANQCQSGHCADGFCCNLGCVNPCDACDLSGSEGICSPKLAGTDGDPSCSPYLCNGGLATCPSSCLVGGDCAAGHYCDGTNQCQVEKVNGSSCSVPNECGSGFCVNGVCCDSSCGGSCEACNTSGNLGICSPLGNGASGSPSCSPYVCDGASASCPGSCGTSADCVSSHYCDGTSQCQAKKTLGASCSNNVECLSNACADGVCCNTACGSACDLCNAPGNEGTCLPASPGSSGQPSCSPYLCDGASAGCPSACATSANCASGFVCSGNLCIPS